MEVHEEAKESLERMQEFDPQSLVRDKELGSKKNFRGVVEPAQRLISLYERLTIAALDDFPANKLADVKNRANSDFNLFNQISTFDPDRTTAEREQLIQHVADAYNETFNVLHPLIAYSLHRSADFQRLDSDARATLQAIEDGAKKTTEELQEIKVEAARILEEVRATAAETGVSQQAFHFKSAAEEHESKVTDWQGNTVKLAWALGAFAVASLFIHKIPWLTPGDAYDAIQIAVSKVLIFAVISYMLYLSARNFLSHKHNAIVNRHRQNALMTYQALADAAGDSPYKEAVLNHAAACIYGPQPTGYSTDGAKSAPSARSVVELLSGPMARNE